MTHGSTIMLLGTHYQVEYHPVRLLKPRVVLENSKAIIFRSELNSHNHKSIFEDWLRVYSKKNIEKRVAEISSNFGFNYNRISVKDQRTRWGSCSSKGNLNFNWRLVMAPPECLDYVVIHELAHTKHMNHSKDFWNLVEQCMPNYIVWEKWLKLQGRSLFA